MATLTRYTQTLSAPDQTFTYRMVTLCPDCAEITPNLSKFGRIHGAGECEKCFEPINPICRACLTDDHPASIMQPAFCCECVQAMLRGRANRFDKEAA